MRTAPGMQRVAEVVIAGVAVADDGAGVSGQDLAGVDSFGGAAAGVQGGQELDAGHVHVVQLAVSAGGVSSAYSTGPGAAAPGPGP